MGRPTHELLVERGVVSPEAVMRAEAAAERGGPRLFSELLAAGEACEGPLVAILAERHGWPGVALSRSEIPAEALRLVPPRVALADNILPLSTEGGRLHLAVAAGLAASPAALDRGARLALANKETLVIGSALVSAALTRAGGALIPRAPGASGAGGR